MKAGAKFGFCKFLRFSCQWKSRSVFYTVLQFFLTSLPLSTAIMFYSCWYTNHHQINACYHIYRLWNILNTASKNTVSVLRLLQWQNSIKCSTADNWDEMWRFSDISETESAPILSVFWFYQASSNTLKMGIESVPETSKNFQILTQLSAWEHFIEKCGT